MLKVKDTLRSTVYLSFDGKVIKTYHGADAGSRFETEVRMLKHLEKFGCPFVPRLLDQNPSLPQIVTTNCGQKVEHLDPQRLDSLFAELETFGVRHDDKDARNVTYRRSDGRFCIIDFEFATLLDPACFSDPASRRLRWSGCSDRGKVRANNEDSFVGLRFNRQELERLGKEGEASLQTADFVFAVSDGMGGAQAGELASKMAVEKVPHILPKGFRAPEAESGVDGSGLLLQALVREIHAALVYLGKSYEECRGMETTLSLCWFAPGVMHFAHVGDSRIYHLPASGGIRQLTEDDTHVGWLFRQGKINEREARSHPRRSVLQKALGGGNQFVDPQIGRVMVGCGDRFLLCSDGLVDGLYDAHMLDLACAGESSADFAGRSRRLVDAAVAASGRDNTTALLVEVGGC